MRYHSVPRQVAVLWGYEGRRKDWLRTAIVGRIMSKPYCATSCKEGVAVSVESTVCDIPPSSDNVFRRDVTVRRDVVVRLDVVRTVEEVVLGGMARWLDYNYKLQVACSERA